MNPLLITTIIGPVLTGLILYAVGRVGRRIDKRAEAAELATYQTHVVLRELVRAVRQQAVPMRLPPGW